jgi:uncharacterized protein YheU (UPF0270 family)
MWPMSFVNSALILESAMLLIARGQLSETALSGLIEEFVTRDGTDYGASEVSLQDKVRQVRQQLVMDEIAIVFDEQTESVSLMTQEQLAAGL